MKKIPKKIWFKDVSLEEMALSREKTMVDYLGIEFTEKGDDFLAAKMPVDHRTKQPYGIMHGGASCVLAETVASVAAYFCVDQEKSITVGVEINTSHIKAVRNGYVYAVARPLHLGRTTQVWEIPIHDDAQNLVSMSRLRIAVLNK